MKKGGLLTMDERKLKELKVQAKFAATFKRIMIYAVAAVIALLVTIGFSLYSLNRMYQKYYALNTYQADLRIDIQAFAKQGWCAIETKDASLQQECLDGMNEKTEGFTEKLKALEGVYSQKDVIKALESDVSVLQTSNTKLQDLFKEGTLDESTGMSNKSEIETVLNEEVLVDVSQMATDLKTVSQDSAEMAESTYRYAIMVIIIMVVISIIIVVITTIFIRNARVQLSKNIQEPLEVVSNTVRQMAEGKFHSDISVDSNDELGAAVADLRHSTEITEAVVADIGESMKTMASGDFTQGSINPDIYVGDYIPIREAINNIANTLSNTIMQVKNSSYSVAQGASNMSQGASDLAEGTTDQAAAIQQLTASVESVSNQSHEMAESAEEGNSLAVNVQRDVETGAEKMQLVTDAMARINEASTKIEEVTNSIEQIANQTQLLALNASIEAARAGEAGRGFAVVAEEISELAEQSNQAASNTHDLINSTLQEIRGGNGVVEETREALNQVQKSVNEVADMMKKSGETARDQARAMEEITRGIEQISGVIQNNSATAEESSAVSQELSEQSDQLNDLMEQFKVRE